jgi:hypothetical protein
MARFQMSYFVRQLVQARVTFELILDAVDATDR